MIRRAIGLALGAFMLLLNVERADLVCAKHAGRAPMAMHHGLTPDAQRHSTTHHAGTGADECQTPSQPDCCSALASCSVMIGLFSDDGAASVVGRHALAFAVAVSDPASRNVAPEPPPPRA
jgi:hypothetical protein